MPFYEFNCPACGLRFEKFFRSVSKTPETDCTNCGAQASRQVTAANFSFSHVPNGPGPQNTGVAGIDYNADVVIGRDAEKRWKGIEQRQERKHEVLAENPGKTGFDLRRTPDTDYEIMKPTERKAAESARALHRKALDEIERSRQQG